MRHWQILIIIILAAAFRFAWLNQVPPSLNWDEAAIGWNAKTIFHTRRDEYGTRLPLSFKSFGDYKSPVYIYLTAPVVGLFGTNPFSIRLVAVLAGIASVYLIYLIGSKVGNKKVGLTAAALLAISPWHIMLSRPAFEPSLALMFILGGIYFFLRGFTKPAWFLISALTFVLSLYTYHSPKIFLPAFLIGLALLFRRKIFSKNNIFWLLLAGLLVLGLLFPLIKEMLFSGGASRFQGTSIFYSAQGIKQPLTFSLVGTMLGNYLLHYSPQFLFFGSRQMPRLELSNMGPLLLIEAPFLILGIYYLFKNRREIWSKFLLFWLFIGPLPAVIGREAPHPIRAFNLLPALLLITAIGMQKYLKTWLVILLSVNFLFFGYSYFYQYPVYSAPDWQYGYEAAVKAARGYEDKVNKIIITSHYGQPHIFTYLYQNRDPLSVFWGGMSLYLFRDIKLPEDTRLSNVLLVGASSEIPSDTPGIVSTVNYPDGQPAFRLVKTNL